MGQFFGESASKPRRWIKLVAASGATKPTTTPSRIPEDGYDTAASDCEQDPVLEGQVILRMLPGDDCEYLHQCLKGLKKPNTSEFDFDIRFLDTEGKRISVRVRSQLYAATLVELPTVTESQKSWDSKTFIKTADIAQMLFVFAPVDNEENLVTIPLPPLIGPEHTWPHGLTPPMHDCANKGPRNITSRREMKRKEAEVLEQLLLDEEAEKSKFFFGNPQEDEEDRRERELEKLLERDLGEKLEQQLQSELQVQQPTQRQGQCGHQAQLQLRQHNEEQEVLLEEDLDDPIVITNLRGLELGGSADLCAYDGDDQMVGHQDEEVARTREEHEAVWEEIHELESQLQSMKDTLAKTHNVILIQRIKGNIKRLESDIALKKASIGVVAHD